MKVKSGKRMALTVVLWTAQILTSTTLIWSSGTKFFQSPDDLAVMWPWTRDNELLVKITAVFDLLAAIGLILPVLLNVSPKLTEYAAYGLALLMVAASIFHLSRGEGSQIGVNIFFLTIAIFIAWGRNKIAKT